MERAKNGCLEILRDGETICWQGKSEGFPLLAEDARVQIMGKWIGTGIATMIILELYLNYIANISALLIGGIVLVGVVFMAAPFIERYQVLRQNYWITNQRVILMTGDQTFYCMELSEIDEIHVVWDQTEYGTLVLGGETMEDLPQQMRWRACHPIMNIQEKSGMEKVVGMALFNLKTCDRAERILLQNL